MIKLDETKPFAIIYGRSAARYEQDGLYFDGQKRLVGSEETFVAREKVIAQLTPDNVENAKEFLKQVLRNGPASKASIYRAAEGTNVPWADAKEAAARLGVMKYSFNKTEMWKLPEEVLDGLEN